MLQLLFFLFGLLIGSFVNVVIYRLPLGLGLIFDRSKCPSCKTVIPLYLNIPIFSFLMLGGKSSCCKTKINIQYPIVELFVGLFFLINSYLLSDIFAIIFISFLFTLVLIIIVIDFLHRIIFDFMSYLLIASGIIIAALTTSFNLFDVSLLNSFLTCIFGMFLFWLLRFVFLKFRDVEALGIGDIYLIGGLGAWLGFIHYFYILSISSFIGIIFYLFQKNKTNFEIPFGSALGIAFIIMMYSKMIINF